MLGGVEGSGERQGLAGRDASAQWVSAWRFTRRVREKDTASVGHRRGFGGSAAVGVSGAGYGAGGAGRGARVIAVCSDCIMQSLQSAGERGYTRG